MIILIAALKEAFNLTVIGRRQKQPPEVYYRNKCSYNFRKIHWKRPVPESFFNKVAGSLQLHLKKTVAQVFFSKFCEIFKSTFFREHLRTIASEETLNCLL